jgi:hypothetical protein
LSAPRWLVYYWDLPPRPVDPAALSPGDLVLVRTVDFDVAPLIRTGIILDESGDYSIIEVVSASAP